MHEMVRIVITHDWRPQLIDQRFQLHDKTQNAAAILEVPHPQPCIGQGNEELAFVHGSAIICEPDGFAKKSWVAPDRRHGILQRLVGLLTGIEQSTLVVVVSTLAIAALFNPLRWRIQDWVDRRFYRKKYDALQVLAQFAQTARDETDLDALLAELARVADETLQPEHVSIWLRK